MALHKAYLGRLTIANGQQESNILASRQLAMATALVFYNASAYTGTVAVEVAQHAGDAAAAHVPLRNNGSAVTLTAATAERHDVNGFESIMLDSSGNEGAERVVDVYAILDLSSE